MIINSLLFLYFSFTYHSTENLIINFTNKFEDDSIIQNWKFLRYTRNKKSKNANKLLKRVTEQIKDVLKNIETDKYETLKRLIFYSRIQSLNDVSFFYFETFIIIKSIQRILNINKNNQDIECKHTKKQMLKLHKIMINVPENNLRYPTHRKPEYFYEKVILFEYACIYNDIIDIISIIYKKYFNMNIFDQNYLEHHSDNYFIFDLLSSANMYYYIEYARNTIDKILMIDRQRPICILTSPNGITLSIKCSQKFIKNYVPRKYKIIDINQKKQELDYKDTKCDGTNQSDIDYILNKTMVFNRSSMELFIVLVHYYSIINNVEYKYEFNLTENNLYEVKCSKYNIKKEMKAYYLKKDILKNCNNKTIHKFSSILDYDNEYTTIKPEGSNTKPIYTRVIKISCGHILGLELIDEWFSMFPNLKCHICMVDVTILGSFDTVVYKC